MLSPGPNTQQSPSHGVNVITSLRSGPMLPQTRLGASRNESSEFPPSLPSTRPSSCRLCSGPVLTTGDPKSRQMETPLLLWDHRRAPRNPQTDNHKPEKSSKRAPKTRPDRPSLCDPGKVTASSLCEVESGVVGAWKDEQGQHQRGGEFSGEHSGIKGLEAGGPAGM